MNGYKIAILVLSIYALVMTILAAAYADSANDWMKKYIDKLEGKDVK